MAAEQIVKDQALMSAIASSDLDKVKQAVENGANVNSELLPLHDATTEDLFNKEIVIFLVEKGADVNKKNPDGHTPFTNVLHLESVDLIDYMGKHGADPNLIMADSGVTPLFHALQTDSPAIASMLIKMGADVNEFKPLILAVDRYVDTDEDQRDGYKKVIKELVEKGAILDNYEIDDEYDRPLQMNSLIWLFDNFQEDVDEEVLTMLCKAASEQAFELALESLPEYREQLMSCRNPPPKDPYRGFTTTDVALFNQIFESPSDISICPVCLQYTARDEGCMYMTHKCVMPYHKELFDLYNINNEIEWCTLCGRISNGEHHHYEYADPSATTRPPLTKVKPSTGLRFYDKNCIMSGGGGHEEKVRRFHRMLSFACELQDYVGKKEDLEARRELIEETWKAANSRNYKIPKIIERKDFGFPCTFPDPTTPTPVAEVVAPDVMRPADEAALVPTKHESPNNVCFAEGGPSENGPVWQFHHKQPNGSIYNHEDEFVCANDLVGILNANVIDGRCYSLKCKGKLYPEEIKDIVDPEFYEKYRRLFNKKNQVGGSKNGPLPGSLMRPVENGTCAAPPKLSGRRKTYRKKRKTANKKRKTLNRRSK